MSLAGVTDFIVAGPPGHTTAGPPGHVTAGGAGEVRIGPAASVPVSPAGHVPIDTSQARVPIDTTAGWVPIDGGGRGFGSGGGGGFGGGGGLATGGMMVSVAQNAPATGGANHFSPGGSTPVHATTGGVFTPSGNVPISTTAGGHFSPGGDVRPTPGYFHFTPGGDVRPSPGGSGQFIPGGNVPIGLGGSHFVPGGFVPSTPKLGIDPNTPPARVNPPSPGRVHPHQMTNFHGPSFQHNQNWPSDEYKHTVEVKAWEPKETHPTWQPLEKMNFVLSTDVVDTGALLDLLDNHAAPDQTRPQTVNKSFDFSENRTNQNITNVNNVDASSVSYNDQHLPTFLFEDNRTNTYILAAPERSSGALVAQSG